MKRWNRRCNKGFPAHDCQSGVWKTSAWTPASSSTRVVTGTLTYGAATWHCYWATATCASDEALTGCTMSGSGAGAPTQLQSGKTCYAGNTISFDTGCSMTAYATCVK